MYDEHVHVHVHVFDTEKERGEREREADSMKTDSITQIQVIQRSLRWSH